MDETYDSIAGGLFSGIYPTPNKIPSSGRFSDVTHTGSRYRARYFTPQHFEALEIISSAAQAHGVPLLEVALRWLVHHSALRMKDGGRDGVILGVSSKEQLEQNLDALEKGPLPEDVVKKVDEAAEKTKGMVE